MTYSVRWMVLPDGFDESGRARLSLVASPRVTNGTGTLAGSPLTDWPAVVAGFLTRAGGPRLAIDGDPDPAPLSLVSPPPDSDLWRTLFPATTPVAARGGGESALRAMAPGPPFCATAIGIGDTYDSARRPRPTTANDDRPDGSGRGPDPVDSQVDSPAGLVGALAEVLALGWDPDGPVGGAPGDRSGLLDASTLELLGAGDRADLLDHTRLRGGRLIEMQDRLRRAGRPDLAAAVPIAQFVASLRTRTPGIGSGSDGDAPGAVGPLSPLAQVRAVADADFHQVVGLVLQHPVLATALGLRLDLTTPALSGARTVRVVDGGGQPWNGPVALPQPWSRVVADPQRRLFTMATQPEAGTEVVAGMLDTSPDPDLSPHLVTDLDVAGTSLKLAALAVAGPDPARVGPDPTAAVAAPGASASDNGPDGGVLRLPARRDVGITVAHSRRHEDTVAHARRRAVEIEAPTGTVAGAPVLYADDVTVGYRVDVRSGDGPFRSLMERVVRYTVGDRTLDAVDEGRVEALAAVQQADAAGTPVLAVSEQLFTWKGYSLAAPKPGRRALGVADGDRTTISSEAEPAPGYDLHVAIAARPGSLLPLRFGREYQFRVRAADVAGNSIDPALCDPARTLPPLTYRRADPVSPPVLVPRRRFSAGESDRTLVVRSDGTGQVVGADCQRHLAPPKVAQDVAETHGQFDAAFGPTDVVDPAARAGALAVALRESGLVTDAMVPGPGGQPVPASGLAIVTNDPTAPPVKAAPPRGEPLPNGYYAIHDTDTMRIPWLADPVASGAVLIGLPGVPPLKASFNGTGWPDVQPVRLVVLADPAATAVRATARPVGGRTVVSISLPPGYRGDCELASPVVAHRIDELDIGPADPVAVTAGLEPTVSPRQRLTLVHAVRTPTVAPGFGPGKVAVASVGAVTAPTFTAEVTVHGPTTGQVDLTARWQERTDPGHGPLIDAVNQVAVASAAVAPDTSAVTLTGNHALPDGRRRDITYAAVGTTRFREFFPPVPDGDPSITRTGDEVTVVVPSRVRPTAPVVDAVVPTFTWERSFDPVAKRYTSTRRTSGCRVWLRRPWLETGEGELLGVVVHTTSAEAKAAVAAEYAGVRDLVSQWGSDPLMETGDKPWVPMLADRFRDDAIRRVVTLTDPRAATLPPSLPGQPGIPGPGQPVPASVTVVGHQVRFDPDRDQWFADVDLTISEEVWPFVRLALVRFQPESVPGRQVSPVVVTDFVQLPSRRRLIAQAAGPLSLDIRVQGPMPQPGVTERHSTFTVRQERRIPDPFDLTSGLGSDAGVGTADGWRVRDLGADGSHLARLVLERTPGAPPVPAGVLDQLRAGRVVVEEHKTGWALLGPDTTIRVVWTEMFDRAPIGIGAPS